MKIEFVLIVDVDTIKIVQTVAVLRSGINVFYLSNCLHELGTAARRVLLPNKFNINFNIKE